VVFAAPRGFNPVQDLNDNYQFLYPFGWQEVTVTGADVVYKDVVEPLESVSVTITPTDRNDVTDFGDVADVSGGQGRDAGRDTLAGSVGAAADTGTNCLPCKSHLCGSSWL
jgi:hypothetical protein